MSQQVQEMSPFSLYTATLSFNQLPSEKPQFYFWTLSSIVENFSCHLKFVDLQRLVATNENFAEVLLALVLSMNYLARESCDLMVSFILVDRFQLDKDDHANFWKGLPELTLVRLKKCFWTLRRTRSHLVGWLGVDLTNFRLVNLPIR